VRHGAPVARRRLSRGACVHALRGDDAGARRATSAEPGSRLPVLSQQRGDQRAGEPLRAPPSGTRGASAPPRIGGGRSRPTVQIAKCSQASQTTSTRTLQHLLAC
jgi:hypothetical protein